MDSVGTIFVCTVCGIRVMNSVNKTRYCDCGGHWTRVSIIPSERVEEDEQSSRGMAELIQAGIPVYLIPDAPREIPPHKRQHVLSDLRPGDKFKFVGYLPDRELDLDQEYSVVPARRGRLSFSNVRAAKTYTMYLQVCDLFPIAMLTQETVEPGRRFYKGDKVKHKTSDWKGIVVKPVKEGYDVLPDGMERTEWVYATQIKLIDKPQTVASYIQPENGQWHVRYNGLENNKFSSLLEALRFLFDDNRCAFNRVSRLLAGLLDIETPDWKLDDATIAYLKRQDSNVWKAVHRN